MEEDAAPAAKRARTEREEPGGEERGEQDCEQSGNGQQVTTLHV